MPHAGTAVAGAAAAVEGVQPELIKRPAYRHSIDIHTPIHTFIDIRKCTSLQIASS